MTLHLWQVYGFSAEQRFRREPIATFFEFGDAVTFAGQQDRSVHIDAGTRDRRASGYRPATRDWRAEYEAWATQCPSALAALEGQIEPARHILTDRIVRDAA